jgi:hypothetical protein
MSMADVQHSKPRRKPNGGLRKLPLLGDATTMHTMRKACMSNADVWQASLEEEIAVSRGSFLQASTSRWYHVFGGPLSKKHTANPLLHGLFKIIFN